MCHFSSLPACKGPPSPPLPHLLHGLGEHALTCPVAGAWAMGSFSAKHGAGRGSRYPGPEGAGWVGRCSQLCPGAWGLPAAPESRGHGRHVAHGDVWGRNPTASAFGANTTAKRTEHELLQGRPAGRRRRLTPGGASEGRACRAAALGLRAMLLGVLGRVDVSARPKWLDRAPRSSQDNAPPPSWTLRALMGHLQAVRVPRVLDPMGQRRGQAPGAVSFSQDLSAGACQACRGCPSWGACVSGASKPKSPLAVVGAGRPHQDRSAVGSLRPAWHLRTRRLLGATMAGAAGAMQLPVYI